MSNRPTWKWLHLGGLRYSEDSCSCIQVGNPFYGFAKELVKPSHFEIQLRRKHYRDVRLSFYFNTGSPIYKLKRKLTEPCLETEASNIRGLSVRYCLPKAKVSLSQGNQMGNAEAIKIETQKKPELWSETRPLPTHPMVHLLLKTYICPHCKQLQGKDQISFASIHYLRGQDGSS